MSTITRFFTRERQEIFFRFVVITVVAIFVFFISVSYLHRLSSSVDKPFAFAITSCLLGGIYAGRSLAFLWANKKPGKVNWILFFLAVVAISFGMITAAAGTHMVSHSEINMLPLVALFLFIASMALGAMIKLIRLKIRSQIQTAEISASQSQTELHILQSQLSPHFLFNTLNNLYGISLSQHEKIPALLLKLSDLLRYSVYEAKEMYVPLKDELGYLKNYIDFEKLRIGERLELAVELEEVKDSKILIAPMLLIVFVENAFKHSKNTTQPKIFIYIGMKIWNNVILFSVKNSHKNSAGNVNMDKNGGLGLENVNKRLALLYPNKYDLSIEEDDEFYTVMLRVNAK
jgi:sensor histidine kinase YesM